jgi:hypothetical protein
LKKDPNAGSLDKLAKSEQKQPMDVDKTVGVFDLVVDLASIINSLIP